MVQGAWPGELIGDHNLAEPVAIERPEDRADDEQHDLIYWPWDGQYAKRDESTQRLGDATFAGEDLDRPDHPAGSKEHRRNPNRDRSLSTGGASAPGSTRKLQ